MFSSAYFTRFLRILVWTAKSPSLLSNDFSSYSSIYSAIHGCSNNSLIDGRSCWFLVKHLRMKSFAFSLISSQFSFLLELKTTYLCLIFQSIFLRLLVDSNGVLPERSWYVITPKLQTSTFSQYGSLFTSSGAMYSGEPRTSVIPSPFLSNF